MTYPLIEEDRLPCPFNRPEGPCPGYLELEIEDGLEAWICTECQGTQYGRRLPAAEGTCELGVAPAAQQAASPAGPTWLGPTIGRRPQ